MIAEATEGMTVEIEEDPADLTPQIPKKWNLEEIDLEANKTHKKMKGAKGKAQKEETEVRRSRIDLGDNHLKKVAQKGAKKEAVEEDFLIEMTKIAHLMRKLLKNWTEIMRQ
jgi:hypothetical protein